MSMLLLLHDSNFVDKLIVSNLSDFIIIKSSWLSWLSFVKFVYVRKAKHALTLIRSFIKYLDKFGLTYKQLIKDS